MFSSIPQRSRRSSSEVEKDASLARTRVGNSSGGEHGGRDCLGPHGSRILPGNSRTVPPAIWQSRSLANRADGEPGDLEKRVTQYAGTPAALARHIAPRCLLACSPPVTAVRSKPPEGGAECDQGHPQYDPKEPEHRQGSGPDEDLHRQWLGQEPSLQGADEDSELVDEYEHGSPR